MTTAIKCKIIIGLGVQTIISLNKISGIYIVYLVDLRGVLYIYFLVSTTDLYTRIKDSTDYIVPTIIRYFYDN